MKLMLDTRVLVEICVPGRHEDAKEWFRRLLLAAPPSELLASVVAEFELRRSLARRGAFETLEHFEHLSQSLRFVPLSVEVMRRAASLSTTMQPPPSDADAILVAQALDEDALLVTTDERLHDTQGLDVRRWAEIDPKQLPEPSMARE